MRVFLVFALCFTSWAQETSEEYKLPENFLRFDIKKLRPAVTTSPKTRPQIVVVQKEDSCGHLRIQPADPDMDTGIISSRAYSNSRMPVLKGMPSCQATER